MTSPPAVWLPAIRAGSGADMFTERLAMALNRRGIRACITWLPHWAEYLPWLAPRLQPPEWATVVHCNSWFPQRLIPNGLPLVVTIHSCVHDPLFEPYKSLPQKRYHNNWIHRLEAASVRRADVVTAVSHYTAIRSTDALGRSDIMPLHNWIDTAAFYPLAQRQPHNPFRLLFVGNLNRRKGSDLLPSIMRQLGEGFTLHFTGTVADLAPSHSIPGNMIQLGRLEGTQALVDAYRSSDALLFPTRLEGFGLCAIEAQACGLPVISTDATAIPEVVENGVTGILCPLDDVEAFVTAARRLAEDPSLWQGMAEAAARHAAGFTEEVAVARYIDIYKRLSVG